MYQIVKAGNGYEVQKDKQTICAGLTLEQAKRTKSYLENKYAQ